MQRIIEAIEVVRNKANENSWMISAFCLLFLIVFFIGTSIVLLALG